MSDSDDDPERRTDPRFDEWPIDSPEEDHDVSVGSRWIGMPAAGGGTAAAAGYVFDPEDEVVYEGEIDEDAERVRILERSESQPEGDESLGDWMRRIGAEDEWSSLSDYGSEQLADRPLEATFQEQNTTVDQDYAFFGSYSFPGDDGREHTVEREFTIEDADADRPTVTVDERHFVDVSGDDKDAEMLDTRTETFSVADVHDERTFEEVCREWHRSHPP